jgi:hypothetical protein
MATQYTAGLSSGQILTAATMNSIGAASETYTPTWTASTTNPTLNNGTLSGRYFRINKMVFVQIYLQIGSTTNVGSGSYRWALPFTAASPIAFFLSIGSGRYYDASTVTATLTTVIFGGTTTYVNMYYPSTFIGSASPVVPAVGDEYHLNFWYEMA